MLCEEINPLHFNNWEAEAKKKKIKTALWLPPTATNQPVAWCLTPLLHQFTLHLALLLETKKLNIYKNIYKAMRRTLKQEGEKKEK